MTGAPKWEGPELAAKKNGYNMILAKLKMNFDFSTAKEGNIYLYGAGRSNSFKYLVGIGKSSKDVFFRIWDEKTKSYISERGRSRYQDFLKKDQNKWLIVGIEWSFEGPKILIFEENEKNIVRIPANPPYDIREKIVRDSRRICLFGVTRFAIRTDLVATSKKKKESIVGSIEYVKVKGAPPYWVSVVEDYLLNIMRKLRLNC